MLARHPREKRGAEGEGRLEINTQPPRFMKSPGPSNEGALSSVCPSLILDTDVRSTKPWHVLESMAQERDRQSSLCPLPSEADRPVGSACSAS